jgi:hypothetical protein
MKRVLIWIWVPLVVCSLMALLVTTLGMLWLADGAAEGVHIVIDGQRWLPAELDAWHWLAVTLALTAALLVALLAVGLVVPLTLLAIGGALAFAMGVTVLTWLGVTALLLSPLALVLLLAWLLLRPRRGPAPSAGVGPNQNPPAS